MVIAQKGVPLARGGDGNVQTAAVPEVGDGDAAAVEQQVRSGRMADLVERAVTVVAQVAVPLPSVPRTAAEICRVEEHSRLVVPLTADDVVQEVELDLGAGLVFDPAVRRVDVLPAVVVEVRE